MAVTCTVTVNYNANGGSGAPQRQIVTSQNVTSFPKTLTVTLRSGEPTRSNWAFLGWSQNASATSPTYQPGGTLTYTFPTSTGGNQSATITLYAVWSKGPYTITYRPGTNGSGSVQTQSKTHGVSITLKGAIFTRTGYSQVGWATSDGGSLVYALSASYTANSPITLYPVWEGQNSTITSLSSSVPIDNTTTGTLTLNRKNNSYLHRVEFTFGSYSKVETNVGQGQSGATVTLNFTIPTSWLAGLPSATSGTATCTVKTFSGSTLIGTSVSKSFTITVPASVKPSVSLSGTNQSSNTTVSGWGILVQNYSTIKLTVTATAGSGASITKIAFGGDGVNQSGTGTTVTSAILTTSGSRTWTVTVTDSRGRSTTVTLTRTVYAYTNPSISSLVASRALQDGTVDETAGTYIKAKAAYSFASCNGNNSVSVKKIEYKLHTASSWSTGQSSAASGTYYTFGGGNIDITKNYDVRVTVTDALGNTATYVVLVASVVGFSFGLNGECARFGGPVQYADKFENDFEYLGHGNATIQKADGTTGFYAERTDTGTKMLVGISGGDAHGIYSHTNGNWLIYFDSTGKARIPTTLYLSEAPMLLGHSGALGDIKTANLSSDLTIATATNKAVVSIQLYAGTWIIVARARFSANATGYRKINITSTSASSDCHMQVPAVSGAVTQLALTRIVSPTTTTTYYLNAYQNSGSSLTMSAGGYGEINALTAIRIL